MTFDEWMQGNGPATFECAFKDGAASRDAEIDQLRAELEYDQRNAAMSQSESARLLDENTKLRTELAAAIAACKAKDAALQSLVISGERSSSDCDAHQLYCEVKRTEVKKGRKALAIQPDYAALKAFIQPYRDAMQTFCARVDAGEVRSTRTYAQFKEILK